jgi:hypothetical protein
MKKIVILCACIALTGFVSCQKQQTEEERKAEIDRQVEQRLAAERQTEEQQKLAQRQAELDAREKALAEKENVTAETPTPVPRPRVARESAASEPTGSYNTFYTKLDRYGDWRETSDYGYVWQPREAESSRNWRPYTNGRWVYSDAGWTWVSEEPFGWATYHYGRWTRLRNVGWVWVPGDEWAPAWVSWRKSNDYVGWAPLPPEARFDRRTGIHNWSDNYYDIGPDQYSFVPTAEFGAQRVEGTVLPSERNVVIINQTTNVTNITYSNTTIVNQGPNFDELRTRTRQPIARLRLEREMNVDPNAEARPVVRGEVVFIPAPLIARGQVVERPKTVKERVATVAVDRGWEGISDRQAAEKARTKMKSESTPPSDAPSKTFVKPAIVQTTAVPATPVESASPVASATISPSASPTATPVRRPAVLPTSTLSPSPGASATAPPVSRVPERRFTPAPTVKPSASIVSSATPAATASSPEAAKPATSLASETTMPPRRKPTPSAILISPAGAAKTDGTPGERPRIDGRFESQARKSVPNKIVPTPTPGSPAAAPTRSTNTPTPAPQVSATQSNAAVASPSPNQKGEERGTHRRGTGTPVGPGDSASPTPTPSTAPE